MAGVRVKLLLVVLMAKLLLVSVRAWEPVDENKLRSLYETGQWTDLQHFTEPDGFSYNYDDGDFSNVEDAFSEMEGIATVSFDSSGQNGLQTIEGDFGGLDGPEEMGGSQVLFAGSPSRWSGRFSQLPDLDVVCADYGFQVTFLMNPLSEVKVLGTTELLPVVDAPMSCGYEVNTLKNVLNVPFTGCHVKYLATCNATTYSLQFLYVNKIGQHKVATAICEEERQPSPRSGGSPLPCPLTTTAVPITPSSTTAQITVPQSLPDLNECTPDRHFVFTIERNSTSIPVDPTKLVIPGHPECQPIFVNATVAIFKFHVTKCGSRTYELGDTKVFLAEVQTVVEALNLKYGVITRSHPLRFLVECRYSKTGTVQSTTTIEFGVKMDSSPLPSVIFSDGIYGVELRIAKDETYTSFLPTNSLPLNELLGTKMYFELNLISKYPEAILIVKYCLAYPRSAKNALVLIYKGCTNPNNPYVYIIVSAKPNQRRIAVLAFQFMEQKTNMYLNEDIIFMCSTEVCIPSEKQCDAGCFSGTSK